MNDSVQAIQESYTRIKLLANDIQIKDQTISILQERLQELEDQVQASLKSKEYTEKQFQILQEEHDAMFDNQQKKNKQLQSFNQQLLLALKEVQEKNQELLEKVKYQQQELNSRQQAQQELQDQVSLIKDAVKGLEDELVSSQKKISTLKKEKQEHEAQIKALQQEKVSRESQVHLLNKQLEAENELLKNEISDYHSKLEAQHNELVELKYIKIQYEDLESKCQQLNDQYSMAVKNSIECEKNFSFQFDEMNKSNQKIQHQCNDLQQELKATKEYIGQVETQNKEFQRLFNYIQSQINETIEDVLTVRQKKITVYERLYEGRKSNSSRKSVPKKKKKTSYNQIQIEEFFNDIKEIIQSLISTNTSLKEENDQLNKNMIEMHKVGEQLRYRIEQLNAEYQKARDQMQFDHQLLVEQQEEKINQLEDTIQQQNEKAQQDNQYINELLEQCNGFENQLRRANLDIQQEQQTKADLQMDYEELKNFNFQLQKELEEVMVRKAISQNKVALGYGFIAYLVKVIGSKRNRQSELLVQLGNYTHYFLELRNRLWNRKLKPRLLRFRKVVHVVVFVRKLIQINRLEREIDFTDNDLIDEVFEKFIPAFHSKLEDGEDVGFNIVQQMHKEIVNQLFKYSLYNFQRAANSQNYFQILNYSKEDTIKCDTIIGQIDYYKSQLQMLQSRVYQLDAYIGQLENELQEKQEERLQEMPGQQLRSESSPQKEHSISASLQHELLSILNKKGQPLATKPGTIVKQVI